MAIEVTTTTRVPVRQRAAAALVRGAAAVGWAEPEVLGLREFVGRGDVCLDVGAAYGMYSHVLAELVGPRGAVYAFEPLPASRAVLRAGVRLSGSGVAVVADAVGSATGASELVVPTRLGVPVRGWAHAGTGAGDRGRRVPVRLATVDAFCAERRLDRVRFLKVDVEGYEAAVLHGAAATLARSRPVVQLEIEQRHLDRYGLGVDAVVRSLTARGYRLHAWRAGSWRSAAGVVPGTRNYLFLP